MTSKKTYRELRAELSEATSWFESAEDFELEKATEQYKKARDLIEQMTNLLDSTELEIKKLESVD